MRFMDSACLSRPTNFSILLGLDRPDTDSPILQLMGSHFQWKVPIFGCHEDAVVLHYPAEGPITVNRRGISAMLAISGCFAAFHALREAVAAVEPEEAPALLEIFKETFTSPES